MGRALDFQSAIKSYNEVPFELLNCKEHIDWFWKSAILRVNSHLDREMFKDLKKMLYNPQVIDTYKHLFWLVHYLKFKESNLRQI